MTFNFLANSCFFLIFIVAVAFTSADEFKTQPNRPG
jgi:hypothetical protein